MNTDYRLKSGFLRHPKTVNLRSRLGSDGVLSLIQLFEFTSMYKSDGLLGGMDSGAIEIAADWRGESGLFVATIMEVGFLDGIEDGEYSIHDWPEHNSWAAGAKERSAKGRKAANARHGRTGGDSAKSKSSIASSSAPSIAPGNAPFLTYPCPSCLPLPSLPSLSLPDQSKKSTGSADTDPGLDKVKLEELSKLMGKVERKFPGFDVEAFVRNPSRKFKGLPPPEVLSQVFNDILKAKTPIASGKHYCEAIYQRLIQNYNEARSIEQHEERKKSQSGQLSELCTGIVKPMPGGLPH